MTWTFEYGDLSGDRPSLAASVKARGLADAQAQLHEAVELAARCGHDDVIPVMDGAVMLWIRVPAAAIADDSLWSEDS